MRIVITFLATILTGAVYAQSLQPRIINEFISRYENDGNLQQRNYRITNQKPITSVSIQYNGVLNDSKILVGKTAYPIYKDEHSEGDKLESSLVVFEEPVLEFTLQTDGTLKSIYRITAIHSPEHKVSLSKQNQDFDCTLPEMISQSSWRDGLPAPSTSRSFTTTRNVIVHHSATFNNLTDYTNVVRNIYLFHTQDRGWSDVGYNYLIAPDGVIYAGRDPLGGEQDNVIGAHFCGRNSGTMGICLLGNLSLIEPAEEALQSLNNLISWKLLKDRLDPDGINNHPLNSELPIIAGHRDGCATECPGNFTYPRLNAIREGVLATIESCINPEPDPEPDRERVFAFGPNPSDGRLLNVRLPADVIPSDVSFTDLSGKPFTLGLTYYNESSMQLDMSPLPTGIYIMSINSESFKTKKKIVIE